MSSANREAREEKVKMEYTKLLKDYGWTLLEVVDRTMYVYIPSGQTSDRDRVDNLKFRSNMKVRTVTLADLTK